MKLELISLTATEQQKDDEGLLVFTEDKGEIKRILEWFRGFGYGVTNNLAF
jgi:hypothetical protein